jgi:hypothetical protein
MRALRTGIRPIDEVPDVFGGLPVDQFVVFIDPENAVRREALDGERSSDPDLGFVIVGLVVKVFVVGFRSD